MRRVRVVLLAVVLLASLAPGAGAFNRPEALAFADMNVGFLASSALIGALGGSAPFPFGAGVEARWPLGQGRWRASAAAVVFPGWHVWGVGGGVLLNALDLPRLNLYLGVRAAVVGAANFPIPPGPHVEVPLGANWAPAPRLTLNGEFYLWPVEVVQPNWYRARVMGFRTAVGFLF